MGGHADAASRHELLVRTLLAPDLLQHSPHAVRDVCRLITAPMAASTLRVYYNLGPCGANVNCPPAPCCSGSPTARN
jgi:hypothetical protein